jgi:thymidylate synthase
LLRHDTLGDAYRHGLAELLENGESVPSVRDPTSPASGFGGADRPSIELIGHAFEVTNPRACLVDSEARPLRLPYCFGSLLWTLAASNDLEHLQCYHPQARNFSDDGVSLSGAFGKRLFDYGPGIDQVDAIIERLTRDPASRRTYAAICEPTDNVRRTREYPCCIGVQYFLRRDALHALTYMRAQHALLILPYDAFLFMALQCIVAARLGVAVGPYRHFSGTFHLYEAEVEHAQKVLDAPLRTIELDAPSGRPGQVAEILAFEERARAHGRAGEDDGLRALLDRVDGQPGFVRQSQLAVLAHWFHEAGDHVNPALDVLPASLRTMLRRQWETARSPVS